MHGKFRSFWVLDQLNLKPYRWAIFRRYMRCSTMIGDLYWAFAVIYNSYWASQQGYVMSYGQVWLPLLH